MHINLTQVGTLGTLLTVFSIILAVPSGYIAVKLGGFKTLILALLIYSLGFVGVGFSQNYQHLLLLFTIGGVGFGLFHPIAFALIAKGSAKEKRGSSMGNFSAFGDLGKIGISTLLTLVAVYLGWKNTAFLYGSIAISIALFLYFYLLKKHEIFTRKESSAIPMSLWQILKNKRFICAAATNIFDNFASQSLFIFLPFLLLARGFSPSVLGLLAGAFFVGNFTGRLVLGKFVDIYGSTKVFIASEILMALLVFVLANISSLYLIIGCALILGIFTKGTGPIVKTMVSESVEHHGNYEKAYGLNSITSNSAIAISSLALGYISNQYGITVAFNIMAVLALVAVIPAMGFYMTKKVV